MSRINLLSSLVHRLRNLIYLSSRSLLFHWRKNLILTLSLTVTSSLPLLLTSLTESASNHLLSRATSTPLILGAQGSPLELALGSLYFSEPAFSPITYAQSTPESLDLDFTSIPIHSQFRAHEFPIIGTTLDYLNFRALNLISGRLHIYLGECVIGSTVASKLNLKKGDTITSSPENLFNLAGSYPLELRITGILAPKGTSDDRAIFTDLKTAWIIAGLGHGHQDLTPPTETTDTSVPKNKTITATAALRHFQSISPENLSSIHFHGSPENFPVSSSIILPADEKTKTILLARYQNASDSPVQLIEPDITIEKLLRTVFTAQRYLFLSLVLVAIASATLAILIFSLSLRLRKKEFQTMKKLGASPISILSLISIEITSIVIAVATLTLLLTTSFLQLTPWLISSMIK